MKDRKSNLQTQKMFVNLVLSRIYNEIKNPIRKQSNEKMSQN